MLSERLKSILLSRTDFSPEDIERMTEADGWKIVYSLDALDREKKQTDRLPEVCFTGFGKSDRERLANIASTNGFLVKEVVTKDLVLLVAGENAGPSKLKKAEAQNCTVVDESGFLEYINRA
jgi:DNA ligase (NAD+)